MKHPRQWSFDVDRYVNRVVPPPPWRHVPYPVSRFLGHRPEGDKPKETGNLAPIFWAFIGVFCGVAVIEVVGLHIPSFDARDAPLIVGSFGAAAVLEFYAIESPLAQPRNAILGQLISSVVGVAVCKLFLLGDFDRLQWLGGAIACAAATSLMALTKTVHPPAGATALLAVTDHKIVALGWFLVPVVLLGGALMLVVALLVNNVGRRFPLYWWTPEDLRRGKKAGSDMFERRRGSSNKNSVNVQQDEGEKDVEAEAGSTEPDGEEEEGEEGESSGRGGGSPAPSEVVIRPGHVSVPEHMYLTQEEKQLLEMMSQRL